MRTSVQSRRSGLRHLAALAAIAVIATACATGAPPASSAPSGDASAAPSGDGSAAPSGGSPFGDIERPVINVGYRLPSLNSVASLWIAQDKGFWKECGLEDVRLVQTEEVQAGVIGGGLDYGIIETVDFGDAALNGLPLKLIAGYRPYSRNVIAVRPEIKTPADLAGKDILLGGTPGTRDFDVRFNILKANGYDLTGVPYNAVSVDGGSDAWVALLEEGKLFMTPIFNRHYNKLKDEGMQFWADQKDFGSDHVGATADKLAAEPNTTAAFLCGLIKGIQVWKDPANKQYVLDLAAKNGIEITDGIKNAYELDIENYDPYDGGPGPYDKLAALFADNLEGGPVDLTQLVDVTQLDRAQEYLGLPATAAP